MSTENNWQTASPPITARAINKKKSTRADWLVPAALILLSIIPFLGGVVRLFSLAGGTAVTPENERFFAAPLPVIVGWVGC
jgi:hypothetical protein